MPRLTKRHISILKYIDEVVQQRGYPPTIREIANGVGLASTSTVHGHLDRIERMGLIRRDPSKPRALEIVEEAFKATLAVPDVRLVPLFSKGCMEHGFNNTTIAEYVPLPSTLFNEDEVFIVFMEDDSMKDVGIFAGDQMVVRQQTTANNGDIVLAAIDKGHMKINRFFQEDMIVRLQPDNASMKPIYSDHVTVKGKVIAVFRGIS